MDPVKFNLFGIPAYLFLWLLAIISLTFFIKRVIKIISILNKARPENRWVNFKKQIVNLLYFVFGQRRLFNEKPIGLPHFLFFWGFVFYALSFWWNLIRGLLPFLPIPYSDEVPFIVLMMEIMGVLVLLSIIVAVVRRLFFAPPHLQKSRDAAIILTLIAILMITFILGQGFKDRIETQALSPVGTVVASSMVGLQVGTAHWYSSLMWWIHMVTVLFFLAYIPYSKHLHLLASPFNVLLRNDTKPADLTISSKSEDASLGASKWTELTWKDLLNSFSCAECGRCDRVCPSLTSGLQLSPRLILHEIKEHMIDSALSSKKTEEKALLGGYIHKEELWQCTTCMACMQNCPVLNEHIPVFVSLRRYMVNEGDVEPTIQDVLQKLTRYGNSFGQSDRNRAKWTAEIEPKIKDARKEEVEYLWITGDYASFDSRLLDITRKTAKILQKAGVDFGILYEGERNSGNDVRRIGEEGLFETLRDKNLAAIGKANFKKIITTDPHTYNTLKNEYHLKADDNGKNVEVLHYTELFDSLIKENKLKINKKLNISATYHDPCYLGRYNGVYNPPRQILKSIGVNLKEMKRNKSGSYCCGAGGGRIWMEDKIPAKERPSESRVREAVALDHIGIMVVACPKDIVMFQDAAKTTGNENNLVIKDISELLWDAIES